MRIITLNDIILDSSSVPEDQYNGGATPDGEYNPATSYSTDQIVYYTGATPHRVYKSLDNSNQGNTPPDSPTKWGDLGATDRWRMFDEFMNTKTTDTSPLEVSVDASNMDTVGLFNLTGSSISLTHVIDTNLADAVSPSLGLGWNNDAGNTEYDCDGTQPDVSDIDFGLKTVDTIYYEIVYIVQNYSQGTITPFAGANTGTGVSANGTYTDYVLADGSSSIGLRASDDFIGSIGHVIYIRTCGKREEINLLSSNTTGWYSYFTVSLGSKDRVIWSFPRYANSTLKLQVLNVSGDAACGVMGVGVSNEIGDTEYGADFGIDDYSYKSSNSVTGETKLQQGNYADEGSFDLWLTYAQIDYVKRILTGARGTAAIYDFNNQDNTDPYLIFYGFYEKFRITIPSFNLSRCALDIQGLI